MATPYMPFYTKDFLVDDRITAMPPTEQGLWILLMIRMWNENLELPDDPARIARILRMTSDEWQEFKRSLIESGLIFVENGFLLNRRLIKEFHIANEKIGQKISAGRASGAARREKAHLPPLSPIPSVFTDEDYAERDRAETRRLMGPPV
jgi:uncharacterized protein YdaU (DUF1376 family)